jgi:hypothetical protein
METTPKSLARRATLPLVLIAAVIQGCLVPTTVQLMAEYAERSSLWVLSALEHPIPPHPGPSLPGARTESAV